MSVWDQFEGISNYYDIAAIITREQQERYPEPPLSLPDDEVDRLNIRHTVAYDKFHRMFAGSASELLSFRNGVVEIEITTKRRRIVREGHKGSKLFNQAIAWAHERLLLNAHSYVVHLMVREKAVGAVYDAESFNPDQVAEDAREIMSESVDVKLCEWRGPFHELLIPAKKNDHSKR